MFFCFLYRCKYILIHYFIPMTYLFSRPEHSSYVLLFMSLLFPKYIFDVSRSYNRYILLSFLRPIFGENLFRIENNRQHCRRSSEKQFTQTLCIYSFNYFNNLYMIRKKFIVKKIYSHIIFPYYYSKIATFNINDIYFTSHCFAIN